MGVAIKLVATRPGWKALSAHHRRIKTNNLIRRYREMRETS